jgi:radical SAM protein with 4Fe4S-binding SPASM domain
VINDLAENNYNGTISYSRYNEPFLNINLLKRRTNFARKILPNVKLVTNTNGDFIDKTTFTDLAIDEMTIMDYDNKGLDWCYRRLQQWGAKNIINEYPFLRCKINTTEIIYYVDWKKHEKIVDRGGLLSDKSVEIKWKNNRLDRKYRCFEPKHFLGIDYTGKVVPCCQIRSDFPLHKKFILGNLKYSTLHEIYHNSRNNCFINNAFKGNFAEDNFPCLKCQKEAGRYTRDIPGIKY